MLNQKFSKNVFDISVLLEFLTYKAKKEKKTYHIFMKKGTEEKDSNTSKRFTISHADDRQVKMSNSPTVHRHVPSPPKRVDVIGVPPIAIEIAISELEHLPHQIQKRMEHYIKG